MMARPETSVARRAEASIALACSVTGVDRSLLLRYGTDTESLWLRRLTAWLMRDMSNMEQLDIAAWLGVTPEFVSEACFTVRRRLAGQGITPEAPTRETADAAAIVLRQPLPEPMSTPLPVSDCLAAVALAFGLSHAEITSNGRALRAARARHCFCWLAGIATTAEPKEIGRRINRGRTAVSYGAAFVNRAAAAPRLREDILIRLDDGRPSGAELLGFGQRLETLTRPADMERLNP